MMKSIELNKFINGRKVKPIVSILIIWIFTFSFLHRTLKPTPSRIDRSWGSHVCGDLSESGIKTSLGCILESSHSPDRLPKSVEDPQSCDFFNENFLHAYCGVEWDMHLLVREIINPSDTVIEFGGRYGTTTCAIAVQQNNSGALIAVEPDPSVWAIQEFNKLTHNCASWSVLGVVGEEDQTVHSDTEAYGYQTKTSSEPDATGIRVNHFTWDQVETSTRLIVDTVIFDCEGCWCDIVTKNKDKFRKVKKIIIENDNVDSKKTKEAFTLLESLGFKEDKRSTGEIQILASLFVFTRE